MRFRHTLVGLLVASALSIAGMSSAVASTNPPPNFHTVPGAIQAEPAPGPTAHPYTSPLGCQSGGGVTQCFRIVGQGTYVDYFYVQATNHMYLYPICVNFAIWGMGWNSGPFAICDIANGMTQGADYLIRGYMTPGTYCDRAWTDWGSYVGSQCWQVHA